jgi:hypothetical protein
MLDITEEIHIMLLNDKRFQPRLELETSRIRYKRAVCFAGELTLDHGDPDGVQR